MFRTTALIVGLAVAGGLPAFAQTPDTIRKKLEEAKAAYEKDVEKARQDVTAWFTKAEAAARKDGNKQLVDKVVTGRRAFEETGEIPKAAPATLRTRFASARYTLEGAYEAAVSAYTKAKQDGLATAVEKEREDFLAKVADPNLPVGKDWYRIGNSHSGMEINVPNASKEDGTRMIQWPAPAGANQQWRVQPAGQGWYTIESRSSDMLLTWSKDGNRAVIRKRLDGDDAHLQHWRFAPAAEQAEGEYAIHNRATRRVLAVDKASKGKGAEIILAPLSGRSGTPDQHWKLIPAG